MFNALKYAKILEDVGFSREQAETHMQIIMEIIENNLATKQDVDSLRNDLHNSVERLEHKLVQLEYRLIIKLGTIITIALGAFTTFIKLF
jgi:hypothetical protein